MIRRIQRRAFGLRALPGFIAGCLAGSLLRTACEQAKTALMPVLNRIGRLSEYRQLRTGYIPLLFGEDLPEFVGFVLSTPFCEYYKRRLGLFAGTIRSALGMRIGAVAGEIFKGCSTWWCELTTADVLRDELERQIWGRSDRENGLWQEDLLLGLLLGISVVVGHSLWLLIERKCGISTNNDVLGNTVLLAIMLITYKISCRKLRAEPVRSTLRLIHRAFDANPPWKDPDSLIPQCEVERVRRCKTCNRFGIPIVAKNYDRCL